MKEKRKVFPVAVILMFAGACLISLWDCQIVEEYTKVVPGLRNKNQPVLSNQPIVYHFWMSQANHVAAGAKGSAETAQGIPGQLIISPGTYRFMGDEYVVNREGLWRFMMPGKKNVQRIVYHSDVNALVSGVSWIAVHGNTDDKLGNRQLSKKALREKVTLTCSHVVRWTSFLLSSVGVEARPVKGIAASGWNTWNNGHSLLELFDSREEKWVVFDVDNDCRFFAVDSQQPLSFVELSRWVGNPGFMTVALANGPKLDASGFRSPTGYDYVPLFEGIYADMAKWYARVIQVPLIRDGNTGTYLFFDARNRSAIESYSKDYKYLEEDAFFEKFYEKERKGKVMEPLTLEDGGKE